MNNSNYFFSVFVKCMTFNQSAYIEDAMNGFCIQKTNFPFVCAIVDDASTDGEPEIINNYFQNHFVTSGKKETKDFILNFGRHKENQNCYFVVIYLKYKKKKKKKRKEQYYADWQNKSKYIALCEGDDFWIDSQKLQRQFLCLEGNEDISLTSENGLVLYTSTGETKPFSNEETKSYSIDDLLIRRRFPTASVMFRAKYLDELTKNNCNCDTIIWAYLSTKGKIQYTKIISSIYRRGPGITENDKVKWAYTSEFINNQINTIFNPSTKVRLARRRILCADYKNGIIAAFKKKLWYDLLKLFGKLSGCWLIYFVNYVKYRSLYKKSTLKF